VSSSVVSVRIDIAASPQEVFDYAMAPASTPEWVTIVREVDEVDHGPLRVGFHMGQTLELRGVPFHVRWVLAELDAPAFARWEGKGPARSRAVIENRLSPHDGGTRFDYRNEFHTPFGALGAVAGRALMGGIPEREATASLARLKEIVEGGARAV
jgi:uncharacterized protein YndB with AHSA1/START domain